MITFEYIINSMPTISVQNETDYVVQVNFTYKGTKEEYSSEISNSIFFETTEGNFIPYNELTKEIVEGWIVSTLGEDTILNYQECIADQIKMQTNPPVTPEIKSLPWN